MSRLHTLLPAIRIVLLSSPAQLLFLLAITTIRLMQWLYGHRLIGSLLFLALLGAIGANAGGADIVEATVRATFWGAFAMALTAGIRVLVGTAV